MKAEKRALQCPWKRTNAHKNRSVKLCKGHVQKGTAACLSVLPVKIQAFGNDVFVNQELNIQISFLQFKDN